MQKINLLFFQFLLLSLVAAGQSTYLPLGTEEYHLLDRLETLNGSVTHDFHTALKPISRKAAVSFLKGQLKPDRFGAALSSRDYYNIERALSISGEWSENAEGDDGAIPSRRPILKHFYQVQPDLLHVHTEDFFLVVNPVLYLQGGAELQEDGLKYVNTRGAEVRGRILDRVGFYTMLADNQIKPVSYIRDWERMHSAYPGMDYYSNTGKGGYDMFSARGYVDVAAIHDHLNIIFGYDKQFSGEGLRSLLLSDFSAPATFLRLRSQIGRLAYENLYLELAPDYLRGADQALPRKYASMHQLSINATSWLNLGIFESTLFSRPDHFSAAYLVPVLFYNTAARSLGAQQKTSLGFNAKAIVLNALQLYGQGWFDQLKFSELGKGWWGNQFGFQVGAKYFNAFSITNLDLQGEVNAVRPFTYASGDKITSATHYNQPMAHPLEAAFSEFIGIARYQPANKLYLNLKAIYVSRGLDTTASMNQGNSLFKAYSSRDGDYGYGWTPGPKANSLYLNLQLGYELRPNLFLEAGAGYLQRQYEQGPSVPLSTYGYVGLRWNIARMEYNFY